MDRVEDEPQPHRNLLCAGQDLNAETAKHRPGPCEPRDSRPGEQNTLCVWMPALARARPLVPELLHAHMHPLSPWVRKTMCKCVAQHLALLHFGTAVLG